MNAFPEVRTEWNPESEDREVTSTPGMTLRDYFAAKAMAVLIVAPMHEWPIESSPHVSVEAYAIADAMLKAREQ